MERLLRVRKTKLPSQFRSEGLDCILGKLIEIQLEKSQLTCILVNSPFAAKGHVT